MRRLVPGLILLLGGCAEDKAPTRNALLIDDSARAATAAAPTTDPPEVEAAALLHPEKMPRVDENFHVQDNPMEGMAAAFPWGNGKDGNWQGTAAEDPKELAGISDADMMQRALGAAKERIDREHALVSIGRRRLPGAMAAFEKAMAPDQPWQVREMALSGLIEHGGKAALPLMWRILRDDPLAQLRGQAIWAVALYGEKEARKAIDTGLSDGDVGVRGMAVLAVWALKDDPDQALGLLETASQSDTQLIFQEAFNTLSRMPWVRAGRLLSRRAMTSRGKKQQTALYYYRAWVRTFPDLARGVRRADAAARQRARKQPER